MVTDYRRIAPPADRRTFTSPPASTVRDQRSVAPRQVLKRHSIRGVWLWGLVLVVIHLPLGIVMKQASLLAKLHGPAVLLIALIWIALSRKQITTAWAVAYISGAELLWRISGGSLFWEFGKMSVVLVCLASIVKFPKFTTAGRFMASYFLALLPGILLADLSSPSQLKINLSNNLSGPASLAIAGVYFSGLQINYSQFKKLLLAFLLPICSVSVLLLLSVSTARGINFTGQSNFATSGGFGPVQVSSCFAAGCLLAYLFSRLPDLSSWTRWVAILVAVGWLGQVALTFSRSGVYIFCGSVLASVPFLMTDKWQRRKLVEAVVLGAVCVSILLPFLFTFTGGKLRDRFADTRTSNRADLAHAEWETFKTNPILGAGLGGAGGTRLQTVGVATSSHTEVTRLLSEHGILGVFALLVLAGIPAARAWRRGTPLARAVIASSTTYCFLFMATCGMRLVVLSFIYGLALLDWKSGPVARMPAHAKLLKYPWNRTPGLRPET